MGALYKSGQFIFNDLEVLDKIGAGSFSQLYRVRKNDRFYALKVPKTSSKSEINKLRIRFHSEAVFLARLNHPGVAKIVDFGNDDDVPYILMEYLQGRTLESRIAEGPLPENEVIKIGTAIANTLRTVHAMGVVHRDIKPANIFLLDSGETKLIDFGLACTSQDQSRLDSDAKETQIVGSFLYSAPEQTGTLSSIVDGRTDLYSLGVVIYECLVGVPPFQGHDLGEIIRQHATAIPVSVDKLKPGVSQGSCAVTAKLLAKDPLDRYQSADALSQDLRSIDDLNAAFARNESIVLGRRGIQTSLVSGGGSLVGRGNELRQLKEACREAMQEQGGFILIEGEPGIGKSRLAKELISTIEKTAQQGASPIARPTLVLKAKCSKKDPLPCSPFKEAIEDLLKSARKNSHEESSHLEELFRQAAAGIEPFLRFFSPELAKCLPIDANQMRFDDAKDQYFAAVAQFFLNLAANEQEVILFIDDVQWLDDASLEVVKKLTGTLKGSRRTSFLVLMNARNDPDSRASLELARRYCQDALKHSVALSPLNEAEVTQLMVDFLGGHPLDTGIVTQIANRGSGSPLATCEYLRALLDAGLLTFRWGTWRLDVAGLESLNLPSNIVDLIVKRIDALSLKARRILTTAAVQGIRVRISYLPEVSGESERDINFAIGDALRATLIEQADVGEYIFIHDRIREALLSQLSAQEKKEIHQRIADVMSVAPTDDEDYVYALAANYGQGQYEKTPEQALRANVQAGKLAMKQFAYAEALTFFRFAETVAAECRVTMDVVELHSLMGESAFRLFETDLAERYLEKAIAAEANPIKRAYIKCMLMRVYNGSYQIPKALSLGLATFDELGFKMPRKPKARMIKSLCLFGFGLLAERAPKLFKKRDQKDLAKHLALVLLNNLFGRACYLGGDTIGVLEVGLRNLYFAHKTGVPRALAVSYRGLAAVYGIMRKPAKSRAFLARARTLAESFGDRFMLAECAFYEGMIESWLGYPQKGKALLFSAMERYEPWFTNSDLDGTIVDYYYHLLLQGNYHRIPEWLERMRSKIAPDDHAAWLNYYARICVYPASQGDSEEARNSLEKARHHLAQMPESKLNWATLALFSYYYCAFLGERGKALQEIDEIWEKKVGIEPRKLPYHFKFVLIGRCHARLAAVMASPDEPDREDLSRLAVALEELKAIRTDVYPNANFLFIQAAYLVLTGDLDHALMALDEAERNACQHEILWLQVETRRFKALALSRRHEQGYESPTVKLLAESAATMAREIGFVAREKKIRREFGLDARSGVGHGAARDLSHGTILGSTIRNQKLAGQLESLLEVSLAISHVFDPEEQMKIALDEVVKILNAERAFLFLHDESSNRLTSKFGRDGKKNDIQEFTEFSTTVVDEVWRRGEPIIITGSEDGEALGSESIITYDLRSIVAAPVRYKNAQVGVLYLDNRLSRGVFTEADVEVLMAITTQIAVSRETSRIANLELERRELAKDLEVTGAVQSLLLPRASSYDGRWFKLESYYQQASQSGGDWWWYDASNENKLFLLLGDATGHGAGAAMITAAMSGAYQAVCQMPGFALDPDHIPRLFQILNDTLIEIGKDEFWMTLTAVLIDRAKLELTIWNAASPPIVTMSREGELTMFGGPGMPLGSGALNISRSSKSLQKGDRLVLLTDGVFEMATPTKRRLGWRQCRRLVSETLSMPTNGARDHIVDRLTEMRESMPLEDDASFVMIDV